MTIAAGFVCVDGVVVCADTQETIPGYTKNSTEKIARWEDANLTLAITGSGDSEMIQTVSQRLIEAGYSQYSPNDFLYGGQAKELIEDAFLKFFKKYLLPFPQNERPFIELLIAIQSHHNRYLLKASGNTVRDLDPGKSPGADCIGTGAMLGHSLIEKLYSPFMAIDELIIVACYLVFQAKKWVDGCGGNTDLLVLTRELRTGPSSMDIEALERVFEEYDEGFGDILTKVANPITSRRQAGDAVQRMRRDILERREKILKNESLRGFFKLIRSQKS